MEIGAKYTLKIVEDATEVLGTYYTSGNMKVSIVEQSECECQITFYTFSSYGYKIYRVIFLFLNHFEKTFTKMQEKLY